MERCSRASLALMLSDITIKSLTTDARHRVLADVTATIASLQVELLGTNRGADVARIHHATTRIVAQQEMLTALQTKLKDKDNG
jgi:hypothetical protein